MDIVQKPDGDPTNEPLRESPFPANLDPRRSSKVPPPPMQVVRRGWWTTTITERSVAEVAEENRRQRQARTRNGVYYV
jgi:hypothetical protein